MAVHQTGGTPDYGEDCGEDNGEDYGEDSGGGGVLSSTLRA
jgi:hypothetical protein